MYTDLQCGSPKYQHCNDRPPCQSGCRWPTVSYTDSAFAGRRADMAAIPPESKWFTGGATDAGWTISS